MARFLKCDEGYGLSQKVYFKSNILINLKGSSYIPCEENITVQLEDGLKKYSQLHAANPNPNPAKPNPNPASDWKWPLLGPYLSQMVSYESSKKVCWIQSDYITDKLARAITQSAGTKLIKGWDEVQALSQKKTSKKKEEEVSVKQTSETGPVVDVTPSLENMANITKMRKIDHLVFVIHGIGQKLSATMGTGLTFINDCDVLRNGLKDSSKQLLASLKASKNMTLSDERGVQVIPIHWRQKLNVEIPGTADDHLDPSDEEYEDRLTLGDIMPEGIPGIRMLISDVILDVLLYMTPKYFN
jgi:hypothetical protein